jgi:hypothetical protein
LKTTFTEVALVPLSLITCALVRIVPLLLTTKPDPNACEVVLHMPHIGFELVVNEARTSTTPAAFFR